MSSKLKKLAGIAAQLTPVRLIESGVTNVRLCSPRTLSLDLPAGAATDGVNRIKITDVDGTYRIQFLRIEEVDLIGGVNPERLSEVIEKFTGVKV